MPMRKASRKSRFFNHRLSVIGIARRNNASRPSQTSLKIIADNPGILYQEFIKKGGRADDLRYDINNKTVKAEPDRELIRADKEALKTARKFRK